MHTNKHSLTDQWRCNRLVQVVLVTTLLSSQAEAQQRGTVAWERSSSLGKGVNIAWLVERGDLVYRTSYTRDDFVLIRLLGFQTVRLPVQFSAWSNPSPPYLIDPGLLGRVDEVLDWAFEEGLNVVLDYHYGDLFASANGIDAVTARWEQLAMRYRRDWPEQLFFEIYNEPPQAAKANWDKIAGLLVSAIRAIDPERTVIVGPSPVNHVTAVPRMASLPDSNVIYTFHFYEPFIYCAQGTPWNGPATRTTQIPFPYDPLSMPEIDPAAATVQWAYDQYLNYDSVGTTLHMRNLISQAVDWSKRSNVPLWCGEFGVYRQFTRVDERLAWIRSVRGILDSVGVPWAFWQWAGSNHGMFDGSTSHGPFIPGMTDVLDLTPVQASDLIGEEAGPFTHPAVYPNPMRSFATLEFVLPFDQEVSLRIFDLLGRQVGVQYDVYFPEGRRYLSLSAVNLVSGIYYYRMSSESVSHQGRFIVLK